MIFSILILIFIVLKYPIILYVIFSCLLFLSLIKENMDIDDDSLDFEFETDDETIIDETTLDLDTVMSDADALLPSPPITGDAETQVSSELTPVAPETSVAPQLTTTITQASPEMSDNSNPVLDIITIDSDTESIMIDGEPTLIFSPRRRFQPSNRRFIPPRRIVQRSPNSTANLQLPLQPYQRVNAQVQQNQHIPPPAELTDLERALNGPLSRYIPGQAEHVVGLSTRYLSQDSAFDIYRFDYSVMGRDGYTEQSVVQLICSTITIPHWFTSTTRH